MRRNLWIWLGLFLVSCGNPSGPQIPPGTSRVAWIEITPTAVLLTDSAQSQQFSAQAFDARGNPVDVAFAWSSTDDEEVSVDASGVATSLVRIGDGQITAAAEGVAAHPASVIIAKPTNGAVLIEDAQVVSAIKEMPDAATPQLGVTLTNVPELTPGTLLIAKEETPLAGRVRSATSVGGQVNVIYEPVPLHDLFEEIAVSQAFDFGKAVSINAVLGEPVSRQRYPDGASSYHFGPPGAVSAQAIKCEGSASFINITGLDVKFIGDTKFFLDYVKLADGSIDGVRALASGKLVAELYGGAKVEAGFRGEYACTLKLLSVTVPIGGVLAAFASPEIPLGVQVKGDGSVNLASLDVGFEARAGLEVMVGGQYTASSGFEAYRDYTPIWEATPKLEVSGPSATKTGLGVAIYLVSGLDVDVLGLDPFSIIEANFGPKQSLGLATLTTQAHDRGYASNYDLSLEGSIGIGGDIGELFDWFGVKADFLALAYEFPKVPLATSPTGVLTLDKTQVEPGGTVHITVELDPRSVKYLFKPYNVRRVNIYEFMDGETPRLIEEIDVLASNQTKFQTDWVVPRSYSGDYTVAAFVIDDLLSHILPLPLEIHADSGKVVTVGGFCPTWPSDPGGPQEPGSPGSPGDPTEPSQPGQPSCDWQGTARATYAYSGLTEVLEAVVYFEFDPEQSSEGRPAFKVADGSVTWRLSGTRGECSYTSQPQTYPMPLDDGSNYVGGYLYIDENTDGIAGKPMYLGSGFAYLDPVPIVTVHCPDGSSTVGYGFYNWAWLHMDWQELTGDGLVIQGTYHVLGDDPNDRTTFEWHFER